MDAKQKNLIAKKAGDYHNLTFAEHNALFKLKLVITGSNLETGKNEFFSVDTTPHMAVADAVRISMGMPFAYKPVRISTSESSRITGGDPGFAGLWVDGGLWNNLPLRAFGQPGQGNGTLGIRLGIPERSSITNFVGFLYRYLELGVGGPGETGQSRSSGILSRVITLDTKLKSGEKIETLDFNPHPKVANPIISNAKQFTLEYFKT